MYTEFDESLYLKKMLPNNLYYIRELRNMSDEAGLNWASVLKLSRKFFRYECKNACTYSKAGISRKFKELVKDCPIFDNAVEDHQHKFLEALLVLLENADSRYVPEIGALILYLEESINKRHELRKKCTGLKTKKVKLNFRRNKFSNNNYTSERQDRMLVLNQMEITRRNHSAIQDIYKERDRMNTMDNSNTMWEVDHIQPILGKEVSGLHVPWNLRVITRDENREKSNHNVY
tara:strand:- start:54 stop:752 length:699 start_codon:yes stop_codon:yes gene_type:complete